MKRVLEKMQVNGRVEQKDSGKKEQAKAAKEIRKRNLMLRSPDSKVGGDEPISLECVHHGQDLIWPFQLSWLHGTQQKGCFPHLREVR